MAACSCYLGAPTFSTPTRDLTRLQKEPCVIAPPFVNLLCVRPKTGEAVVRSHEVLRKPNKTEPRRYLINAPTRRLFEILVLRWQLGTAVSGNIARTDMASVGPKIRTFDGTPFLQRSVSPMRAGTQRNLPKSMQPPVLVNRFMA